MYFSTRDRRSRAMNGNIYFKHMGSKFQNYVVKSHNALGLGERYHAFLCIMLNKISTNAPIVFVEKDFSLPVRANNDTACLTDPVSTLLVFGVTPHLSIRPQGFSNQVSHLENRKKARAETVRLNGRARIAMKIYSNVLSFANSDLQLVTESLCSE